MIVRSALRLAAECVSRAGSDEQPAATSAVVTISHRAAVTSSHSALTPIAKGAVRTPPIRVRYRRSSALNHPQDVQFIFLESSCVG